jgi:hypothetical protein
MPVSTNHKVELRAAAAQAQKHHQKPKGTNFPSLVAPARYSCAIAKGHKPMPGLPVGDFVPCSEIFGLRGIQLRPALELEYEPGQCAQGRRVATA